MDPSTIGLLGFVLLAFGFGALWPIVLFFFPALTLGGLLTGQITMSDKHLVSDDDEYHSDQFPKSEQRKWESINHEPPHTEGH